MNAPAQSETHAALNGLLRFYQERELAARQWQANGGTVVGCLGSDVPEEILIAAGCLPVRICGRTGMSAAPADRYLEQGFDVVTRAQFARIVDGSYAFLDHLVVSHSSDALVRVYYYLRALRRVEPTLHIPDLYFFDFLHARRHTTALYNRERTRDFLRWLEALRGRSITRDDLAAAVAICNENRALLRQVAALRGPTPPRVSGTEALQVIGASLFMPRAEHNRLLRRYLARARQRPALAGIRLFISGSAHEHPRYYEAVEAAGAVIVGEDHEWGARLWAGDVSPAADPVEAIVERYHLRPPTAGQATVSQRVAQLVEQVQATGAQGVVFLILDRDDPPSWDFPEQMRALGRLGIPGLLLERQPYEPADPGEIRQRIASFIDGRITS